MFDTLLAKVGIGNAKVDTVLDNKVFTQGDLVTGTVHILGGKVDQDVNKVTISVMTQARGTREVNGEEQSYVANKAVGVMHIQWAAKVEAGQRYEIPFSFILPSETPITAIADGKNQSKVWVHTDLDIESGLDSDDRDYLTITPHPGVAIMIDKFLQNGFAFKKVDVEVGYLNAPTFSSASGIYQEIEMRPVGGFSWNSRRINEIELSFIVEKDSIHLLVEVDRSFSGDGYTSISYPAQVQKDEITAYFERIFPR